MQDQPRPEGSRIAIAVLIFTVGAFSLNGGFLYPANAFRLNALGYSAASIGAVGSVGAFGYVFGSLLAPVLATRLGLRWVSIFAIVSSAAMIFSFAVVPPIDLWYGMRFVHGITTTTLFVCGETALVTFVPPQTRGRIIGIYTAVNSLFFALGPVVVVLVGFDGILPFAIVALAIAALAVPMVGLASVTPAFPRPEWGKLLVAVSSIPLLLAVIALWGAIDGALLNLLGVYAVKRGASAAEASFLFSLGALGNMLLQFPIGWLADWLPRRVVLGGLAAAGCVLSLLLPLEVMSGPLIIAHLTVLPAVGFGTFTVCLIALSEVLNGAALVVANAAFGLCWGIGSFVGSALTGEMMDNLGDLGFPLALALAFLVQCAVVAALPLRLGKTAVLST